MTRFSGPDDSPGFLLWRVTLAWQRAMRAALAPHDLTHVQFVLLASLWWLVGHSGPPSQQRLAEQAGTDPMMTSQVLRKLADRGLISREVDPADSRARLLDLTAEGKALVAKAMKDVEDADAAYFAGLGDEQQAFVRGLTRLL
ncbi:MarR family winged helix-turn-helix transcriptional regulator [Lentzea aerocolonigenes]|uniref:MarR family winged helix-turn-helix transcriptional regulator n=1 Tax=Lentzea aerocolonigenes TaxID=68170 RepID=UPI001E5950DD|nr:MarR family winged helix-turn-helix transcriptional regulator [Lentzea aerocolonigenes]